MTDIIAIVIIALTLFTTMVPFGSNEPSGSYTLVQ